MIVKVLDLAYLQASALHKLQCYQIHPGPIIYQASCFHAINHCRAQNLSNRTTDSWGPHSKMWTELVMGLSIFGLGRIGLGHTHLGGGRLLGPGSPIPV